MSHLCNSAVALALLLGISHLSGVSGAEPEAPKVSEIAITNSQQTIRFTPYPAAEEFKILKSDRLGAPFIELNAGSVSGYQWTAPSAGDAMGFYKVQAKTISDKDLLSSIVLSRLTYGPTPDEIDRINAMGPEAYIAEQLAPETISETLKVDQITDLTGWQYVTVTGNGTASRLYIYLNSANEGYIDDIKLVEGTIAEQGVNLIRNGDFESPITTNDWVISDILSNSAVTTEMKHSGQISLKLVASDAGSGQNSSIWQPITPNLSSSKLYTLSFWFHPLSSSPNTVTVRLSGSTEGNGVYAVAPAGSPVSKFKFGLGNLDDLQNWHLAHAVQSRKQLLEILTQFFDNHFVTYYDKAEEYMGGRVSGDLEDYIAADFEYRELVKWREILMNPNGTFYDLLKVSAESPTMIIYLDTVSSKKEAANENYARELMELFTMGVDNGYDQHDIEEMSRAWTGWRVDKLPPGQENNPFAPVVANRNTDPGVWTLRFSASNHDTNSKTIFPGKTIDARFGPPHAGKSYELFLPARTGTNGMKDGYEIIAHLADLPYTQEYLSVKLCQLFVHEKFHHGVYDYTASDLSAEAQLIKACMAVWETPGQDGRKGNIRNVLRTIFDSSLFRSHAAARQKVKTPLEFVVSFSRALRAVKPDGSFTANPLTSNLRTDLDRLNMEVFQREEPDGWPEKGQDWISTSSLVSRMRIVQERLRAAAGIDPVALIQLKLPQSQWNDAQAVADYFVKILFPGEGRANLDLDSAAAVAYLNSNEAVAPNSPLFSTLRVDSDAYSRRVRGMVAFLMGLPRFQEQ